MISWAPPDSLSQTLEPITEAGLLLGPPLLAGHLTAELAHLLLIKADTRKRLWQNAPAQRLMLTPLICQMVRQASTACHKCPRSQTNGVAAE
jgi:hypothetical protein